MAKNISALSIHLTMDSRGVVKGAKVAKGGLDALEKEAKQTTAAMKRMDDRATKTGRNLQRVGQFAAGFVSIGLAVRFATSQLESMSELVDRATTLGVRTEELQEFNFALGRMGVQASQTEASMGRFMRRVGEFARTGGGPAAKVLTELNLNARQLADEGLPAMGRVFDAISAKYVTDAERMSAVTALFGDDARSMINAVNAGSVALEQFRQKAREVGTVTDETARELKEADDILKDMNTTLKTTVTLLGADLLKNIKAVSADDGLGGFSTRILEATSATIEAQQRLSEAGGGILGRFYSAALQRVQDQLEAERESRRPEEAVSPAVRIVDEQARAAEEAAKQLAGRTETVTRWINKASDSWMDIRGDSLSRFRAGWSDFTHGLTTVGGEAVATMARTAKVAVSEARGGGGLLGATDIRTVEARQQAERDSLQRDQLLVLREIAEEAKKPAVEVGTFVFPGMTATGGI